MSRGKRRQVDVVTLLERAEARAHSGDLAGALALVDEALAGARAPADRADAQLLAAEIAALTGDEDAAVARLEQVAWDQIEEPELYARGGLILLELGEPETAAELLGAAVQADSDFADAVHGLGVAREQLGDRDGMLAAFRRVLELDAAGAAPAWRFSDDEFAAIAETAMAELPPRVIELLENVPVLIDDAPSEDIVAEGYDPRLLGLFSGVPLPEKSHITDQQPVIDSIHIYKRNLERVCENAEQLAEEIRITVLHETAHFFGLEDEDLHELGLG